MTKALKKQKPSNQNNLGTEYLSSNMSFIKRSKYKIHKSISSIFNDDDFIRNYITLKNNYLSVVPIKIDFTDHDLISKMKSWEHIQVTNEKD